MFDWKEKELCRETLTLKRRGIVSGCERRKDGRQMAVYMLRWLNIPFEGRCGVRFALRGFSTLDVSGVTKMCRRSIRWYEDIVICFPVALCRQLTANLLSVDVWHLVGRRVWLTLSAEEGSQHLYFHTTHVHRCFWCAVKTIKEYVRTTTTNRTYKSLIR